MYPSFRKHIDDLDEFGRNSRCNNVIVRMTVRKAGGGIYVFVTRKTGKKNLTRA